MRLGVWPSPSMVGKRQRYFTTTAVIPLDVISPQTSVPSRSMARTDSPPPKHATRKPPYVVSFGAYDPALVSAPRLQPTACLLTRKRLTPSVVSTLRVLALGHR